MYSIIILTKNEEADLPACLESIQATYDVHVLDSGSEDRTIELAEGSCATVSYHPFESFGKQRNWALENLELKNDWILFLDADERMTPAFEQAVRKAIGSVEPEVAGFYCCWKMMLEDRWLKRCDNFPKWQLRLCRKDRVRFVDFGHGQKEGEVDGRLEYITEPYLHYAFSKGWMAWFERHNRYSSQEARERLKANVPFSRIFSKHAAERNSALKVWLTQIPGWPFLRFLQAYILKLGFIEGRQGFIYCTNMALYEYLIKLKMRELNQTTEDTE